MADTFIKEIVFPAGSDVFAEAGQTVEPYTVIARTPDISHIHVIDAFELTKIKPEKMKFAVLKTPGSDVLKGDVVVRITDPVEGGFFDIPSPVAGRVEAVSGVSGQILVREKSGLRDRCSFMKGTVKKCGKNSVFIEVSASVTRGIYGVGRKNWGFLKMMSNIAVKSEISGTVVVFEGRVEKSDLYYINRNGARGAIVGSIDGQDMEEFTERHLLDEHAGHDFSIVIMEGFGDISMQDDTLNYFRVNEGMLVSIDPYTELTTVIKRPEIIIFSGSGNV